MLIFISQSNHKKKYFTKLSFLYFENHNKYKYNVFFILRSYIIGTTFVKAVISVVELRIIWQFYISIRPIEFGKNFKFIFRHEFFWNRADRLKPILNIDFIGDSSQE